MAAGADPISAVSNAVGQLADLFGKFADGANIDKTASANANAAYDQYKYGEGTLFSTKGLTQPQAVADYTNYVVFGFCAIIVLAIVLKN
jgi:hypothetical protein